MSFEYKNANLGDSDLEGYIQDLSSYCHDLAEVKNSGGFDVPESFINLLDDKDTLSRVKKVAEEKKGPLKYIFLVGIGGASLGTLATYNALLGHFDSLELGKEGFPKIISLESVEPKRLALISKIVDSLEDKNEFILSIDSESGKTIETIANKESMLEILGRRFDDISGSVFVTTDKGSDFWNEAKENNWQTFEIPKKVGGRYSVFSAVGLLPLALAGVNVDDLISGAKQALDDTLEANRDNKAMTSAAALYHNAGLGKKIHDSFFFNPELESLGKWYRQLMAESLGKENNINGDKVNTGITPTVSIGSRDLHSVGQLYLSGPKDKITTFVYAKEDGSREQAALMEGSQRAYESRGLPFFEISFDKITPKSLGYFMQFKMMEIIYLAQLMQVNAFDQPGVELYKIEAKKILGE